MLLTGPAFMLSKEKRYNSWLSRLAYLKNIEIYRRNHVRDKDIIVIQQKETIYSYQASVKQ